MRTTLTVLLAIATCAYFGRSEEPPPRGRICCSVFEFGDERNSNPFYRFTRKQSDSKDTPEAYVAEIDQDFIQNTKTEDGYLKWARKLVLPPMKDGEIVPLDGELVRATRDTDKSFSFEELYKDEYPPDTSPGGNRALIVPIYCGHGEGLHFDQASDPRRIRLPGDDRRKWLQGVLQLRSVKLERVGDADKAVAELRFVTDGPAVSGSVRVGDIVVVPAPVGAAVTVRRIVPRDAKTKTVGWVELSQKYIPYDKVETVAKDEKRTIVHLKE